MKIYFEGNKGFEKKGVYQITVNGMYTYIGKTKRACMTR